MLLIGKKSLESQIDFEIESDDGLETTSNPLDTHRHAADEFLVIENENLLQVNELQVKVRVQDIFFLIKIVKNWHFRKYFSEGSLAIHFPESIA